MIAVPAISRILPQRASASSYLLDQNVLVKGNFPQLLVAMLLIQHQFLSSRISISLYPPTVRCNGHFKSTWAAVWSNAPYSQTDVRASPHLCMDDWKLPTPVLRRLSLTQADLGRSMPNGLSWCSGQSGKVLIDSSSTLHSIYSQSIVLHGCSVHWAACVLQTQKRDEIVVTLFGQKSALLLLMEYMIEIYHAVACQEENCSSWQSSADRILGRIDR